MKVFLLGLPGSGKSTLGKNLATALGIPFIDLDKEIEKDEQSSIRVIFEKRGEDYFRRIESEKLKAWCSSANDFVMATGGGAPVFFDNLDVINRSGKSVFLDVPAKEIARRIMNTELSSRPLFAKTNQESLKDHIEFMRSNRIAFYRKAHLVFKGESIGVKEILSEIRKESQT